MVENNTLLNKINNIWDSTFLCKSCGGLIYSRLNTNEDYCFNKKCGEYPQNIELFDTSVSGLSTVNQQYMEIETRLVSIVKSCDYEELIKYVLEKRRENIENFLSARGMQIKDFLSQNDFLWFIKKYKSYGIRKGLTLFSKVLDTYKVYYEHLELIENMLNGRFLLSRIPLSQIFILKYYKVIEEEIWSSYGLVNISKKLDMKEFKYHEVIEKLINPQKTDISHDYAPFFDTFWAFEIAFQYLVKIRESVSKKYQYVATPTDLANILSLFLSLKNNMLTTMPIMNMLQHFIAQPKRDKNITSFLSLLDGNGEKIPIIFHMSTKVILDRPTLLLFFILLHSQNESESGIESGQQRINQHKEQAGKEYEQYFRKKIQEKGYCCLPASTMIYRQDYDVLAFSETKREILLIETKFRDPSPSSLTADRLIGQEFLDKDEGLLKQLNKHQQRYDILKKNNILFQNKIGLKMKIDEYLIKTYFITKFTPLISEYGNVKVLSEKAFWEKEFS